MKDLTERVNELASGSFKSQKDMLKDTIREVLKEDADAKAKEKEHDNIVNNILKGL